MIEHISGNKKPNESMHETPCYGCKLYFHEDIYRYPWYISKEVKGNRNKWYCTKCNKKALGE